MPAFWCTKLLPNIFDPPFGYPWATLPTTLPADVWCMTACVTTHALSCYYYCGWNCCARLWQKGCSCSWTSPSHSRSGVGSHNLGNVLATNSLIEREKGDSDSWSSHTLASFPWPLATSSLLSIFDPRILQAGCDQGLETTLVIAGVDLAGTP